MKRVYIFFALFAFLTLLAYLWQQRTFGNEKYERIVDSDGKGYVAYLPALFIYQDLSFGFYSKPQNDKIARYFNDRFLTKQKDKTILKTYVGVAALMAPFYLTGCLTQIMIHGITNGYEPMVQFFISMAAIFYALAGLFLIYKTLHLLNFSKTISALTSTLIFAATNLCYYTLFHPTMSHVYSFFLISAFVYLSVCLTKNTNKKHLLLSAVTLGLIVIVRPLNIIIILFPLLLLGKQKLTDLLKTKTGLLIVSALFFLMIISIQPILNYIQCGLLFPWSYGDEGFYFTNPSLLKILFSFRNGLFIYSPLLFLSIPGLWLLRDSSIKITASTSLLLIIVWYLLAAWWNWSSEPAFGNRSFVDWYGLMSLPIAASIGYIWNKSKVFLSILCFGFTGLSTIQTWQYLNDIIHPDGMNFEKYRYVFLKTSPEYVASVGNGNEEAYLPEQRLPFFTTKLNPENKSSNNHTETIFEFNAQKNKGAQFSITFSKNQLLPMKAMVTLQRKELEFKACTQATVCFDYADSGGSVYYNENLRINDIPRKGINEWRTFTYQFIMPALKDSNSQLNFYINNPKGARFEIKNIELKLFNFSNKQ